MQTPRQILLAERRAHARRVMAVVDAVVTLNRRPARVERVFDGYAVIRTVDGRAWGHWRLDVAEQVIAERGGRFGV